MRRRDFLSFVTATAACPFAAIAQSKAVARIVLAYNLTRVMNIVGTKPLMAAIAA